MADVVSDTSPLIHLARIGHFGLLKELYQHVLVPPAVWRETVEEGGGRAGEAELRAATEAGWIEVCPPAGEASLLLRHLSRGLDDGEAEAIALAAKREGALLILDETQGRAAGKKLGIRLTGTLGVLIEAKNEERVKALKPLLDMLRRRTLWISDSLYKRALEAVGESATP